MIYPLLRKGDDGLWGRRWCNLVQANAGACNAGWRSSGCKGAAIVYLGGP